MPIPAGQSCSNCQYWDDSTAEAERRCLWRPTDEFRNGKHVWRRTPGNLWCGEWEAVGGAAAEPEYGLGAARVTNDAGYLMAGIGTWTLIDTPGMSATNMLNWQLQSAGILQLNYGIGEPTDQFIVNFDGIISVAASGNNQEIKVAFGVNGVVAPESTVRMFARQSDTATPIPISGTGALSDQDTIEMYIESSGSATVYDHHMIAESDGPFPAGTILSVSAQTKASGFGFSGMGD